MKKLIKLVPTMALLLALGVYTVNAKMKAFEAEKVQTEENWMLSDPANPTLPQSYTHTNDDVSDVCQGSAQLCGIKAPDNGGQPLIDDDLKTAIESGSPTQNVFYEPAN